MPATLSTSPRAHYRTTAVEADWRARRRVGWGVPASTRHACAAPGRLGSIRARLTRRRLEGTGPGTPHPPPPPPPPPHPPSPHQPPLAPGPNTHTPHTRQVQTPGLGP